MWGKKVVFNKTHPLIRGNDQIGFNTMPQQWMRVKCMHMKHIPFFNGREEILSCSWMQAL